MTTYARIVGGHAVDVTTTDPTKLFHPDVAATFVTVPDGTLTGATFANGVWTPPATAATAPPPPAQLALLTPMTFYMAFTPAERIAIKTSADAMVKEFWATFQLSVQLDKPTDPNLVSVQEGLAYLAQPTTATPPGAGILASQARVNQILAGIPQ